MWVGYLIALAFLVVSIVEVVRDPGSLERAAELPVSLGVIAFAGWIYWLYCVYRFHDVMAQIPGYNHSITPWRAVGMHWIPIYNLYWVFKWPAEIAHFVNWRTQSRKMKGWVAGVFVLAAVIVARAVDSSLGLALLFTAGVYISRQLRRAFAAPPVPASAMAPPGVRGPLGL